jgi:hypothetical protein
MVHFCSPCAPRLAPTSWQPEAMADLPVTDVTTRQDGGVAWRICSGGVCVVESTIPRAQACFEALCRSRGIEPPPWPQAGGAS